MTKRRRRRMRARFASAEFRAICEQLRLAFQENRRLEAIIAKQLEMLGVAYGERNAAHEAATGERLELEPARERKIEEVERRWGVYVPTRPRE